MGYAMKKPNEEMNKEAEKTWRKQWKRNAKTFDKVCSVVFI